MEKKNEQNIRRNTTNYPKDSHKAFCERCYNQYNNGICPATGSKNLSKSCQL